MHYMRANRQMKRASASRSVSASDVRGKIHRRTCSSARTVVKSSGVPDAVGTDFAPKEGTAGTICAQTGR